MEQAAMEYADWAEEERPAGEDPVAELLRMRADEARSPVQTWLMPVVEDMDRCIRERFFTRILQEMNTRLVNGELTASDYLIQFPTNSTQGYVVGKPTVLQRPIP